MLYKRKEYKIILIMLTKETCKKYNIKNNKSILNIKHFIMTGES